MAISAEFASVVNAVACAVAMQAKMAERNAAIDPQRRMQFRIGVNVGDGSLQPRRDVDAVTIDAGLVIDHIADVDADAELHAMCVLDRRVALCHLRGRRGALDRAYYAGESAKMPSPAVSMIRPPKWPTIGSTTA